VGHLAVLQKQCPKVETILRPTAFRSAALTRQILCSDLSNAERNFGPERRRIYLFPR
jgi:hypothetical protein